MFLKKSVSYVSVTFVWALSSDFYTNRMKLFKEFRFKEKIVNFGMGKLSSLLLLSYPQRVHSYHML